MFQGKGVDFDQVEEKATQTQLGETEESEQRLNGAVIEKECPETDMSNTNLMEVRQTHAMAFFHMSPVPRLGSSRHSNHAG